MKTKYLCPSINTAQIRISNLCNNGSVDVGGGSADPRNTPTPNNASKRSVFGDDWEEF